MSYPSFKKSFYLFITSICWTWTSAAQQPIYNDSDLGMVVGEDGFVLKIWSPSATEAKLQIYEQGDGGEVLQVIPMLKSSQGTWTASLELFYKDLYYTVQVKINGNWSPTTADPYVKVVGVNGKRGMITDIAEANPEGWEEDQSPALHTKTDAIIYELQIRDATIHPSAGSSFPGTFLGLTELATVNASGASTGLDHIRSLGVTHVQLMPFFDFISLDESNPSHPKYNWGYEPQHFNALEGSFATDPYDGRVRVREFKQMIQAFHQAGLRVVMDVVYNHTMEAAKTSFEILAPGYFFRKNANGTFSNASACGNEMASEQPMMRKFMIESLLHWVQEYHIDGFRFDLMGIHDIETMNLISKALHDVKPDILLYGEGWSAGPSPLAEQDRALKSNAYKLDKIGVFSDDLRDGIKGSVFDKADQGFATGKSTMEMSVKFGVVASLPHPQIDNSKVNYAKAPYTAEPSQCIQYVECHDNHTLWDKIAVSVPHASMDVRKQMHMLSLSIILTSQGIPFLHAGMEFLRSKNGEENSYESSDSINAINWNLKSVHSDVVDYVQQLLTMRKAHPAFRMQEASMIAKGIRFDEQPQERVVSYEIDGSLSGDAWKQIWVAYNGNEYPVNSLLPPGKWEVAIHQNEFIKTAQSNRRMITLAPHSCTVLFKKD